MAGRGVPPPGIRGPKVPTFSSPQVGRTPRSAEGNRTILTFKTPSGGAFAAQIAQYKASASTLHKGLDKINEQAVRELSREAQRTLRRRIRGRGRQQSRNQTLVDLAGNHKANSSWNKVGFHFLGPKAVRLSKPFPYYPAIVLGSDHMVGKRVPLTFLRGGTSVPPPSVRYKEVRNAFNRQGADQKAGIRPSSAYKQRDVDRASSLRDPESIDKLKDYATYSGRKGAYVVLIRNPIRPYYYITTAVDTFRAQGRYSEIVDAQVRKLAPLLARNLARRK